MRKKSREKAVNIGICVLYIGIVLVFLLSVCCDDGERINSWLRYAASGAENGPVQEAFGALVDGLGDDRPVRDVLSESYEVLIGATD